MNNFKLTNTYTDDHLPCFEFEVNGKKFELLWSERKLEGKLELVQEGELTLEKALKKFPETLEAINEWETIENDDEDDIVDGEVKVNKYVDAGCLTFSRPVKVIGLKKRLKGVKK